MDLELVTIEDSLEMYNYKNQSTILNDGRVVGFIHKDEIEIALDDWESQQR